MAFAGVGLKRGVQHCTRQPFTEQACSTFRLLTATSRAQIAHKAAFSTQSAVPKHPKAIKDVLEKKASKGPRSDLKSLPRDPNLLRLKVKSVAGMTETDIIELAILMNKYGAAVLTPEIDEEEGLAAYKMLDRLLGTRVSHDKIDERGILEINPARPTSINTAKTDQAHLPHTDDAYTARPARFITLQCRKAAPSGGGESVLVSGKELLESLNAEELRELMKPGMVTMGRRPAEDGSWMKCSSIPMFWVNRESGWLQLRWRCNDGCVQDVDVKAESAYQRMDAIARGEVHQLVISLAEAEILIADNRAVAHGRRAYNADEPRIMWRSNYYGDGELENEVSIGMMSAKSSLLDELSSWMDHVPSYSSLHGMEPPDLPKGKEP